MRLESAQFAAVRLGLRRFGGWTLGLLAVIIMLGGSPASAQSPLSNFVFTVGTTIRDAGNNDWSYVVVGSPQPALLVGKKFDVYSKPGAATNSGTFSLRATLFQQTNTAAINALLTQSVAFGQNLASLQATLIRVLRNYPAATNQTLAQNVLLAFQVMGTDASVAQSMALLSGFNPGLSLCAGHSFAEQIAGVTTYEVREVNPATGAAGDVIGRVTISPGSPTVMPAPGVPFQVVTNTPADDLRIRLRWGEPDTLLRLALLNYGFNVWRIPLSAALAANYNNTPPTTAQLSSDTNFTRANNGPVMATKYFSAGSGTGAANDPADGTTYFFADDNGRAFGQAPFADGAQFYYFITARDVLGRDGLVSPGGAGEAFRRVPPSAPTGVKVANIIQFTNQERLLISWLENSEPTDLVTEYWVYRWPNPSMSLTSDAAPTNYRVGVVAQLAGTNANSFVDTGSNAPTVPGVSNYWYSVRAVSQATNGPLLSPPTPPVWAVLRERDAPQASVATVSGSCGMPVAMFQNFNSLVNDAGPDVVNWNYRLTCTRRDPGIAWVQFTITNQIGAPDVIGPLYFAPGDTNAQSDYSLPVSGTNYLVNVTCVVGTYYGQVSKAATCQFTAPTVSGLRQEAVFFSGQLLGTALSASDPLLAAFLGGAPSYVSPSVVKADPSGTVSMSFVGFGSSPVFLQAFTNGIWSDLGTVAPDSNNVLWLSYPACLLGPLPPFRGVAVALAGDCNEHIARAADGGPVAPIHVRFGLTPGTKEFRVYRTVDGGPLSLFAQGAAAFDPSNPGNQIVRTDDGMPASAARLGYFVQLLDQHGHGSPIRLGGFRNVKPPKLPRPVLAQPLAAGTVTNPLVALSWFCPTAGVYRFSIKIVRDDQQGSGKPTGILSARLRSLPTFKTTSSYFGLFASKLLVVRFDEDQLTPPVSTNFGPGPAFSISVGLTPNVPYTIAVSAVDAQGNEGDVSQAWKFTWVPPILPENVPWPFRQLPNVTTFDDPSTNAPRVVATAMIDGLNGFDRRWPVGIRIGDMTKLTHFIINEVTVNTTNFFLYAANDYGDQPDFWGDPNNLTYQRISGDPSKRGNPLLPIVVYRQQVANTNYPHVSGNIIQVTPLIERIPWILTVVTFERIYPTVTVPDLLVACGSTTSPGPNVPASNYSYLYVRDAQPVVEGATYHYYVARMDSKHEIAEIIDAGQVQVP